MVRSQANVTCDILNIGKGIASAVPFLFGGFSAPYLLLNFC